MMKKSVLFALLVATIFLFVSAPVGAKTLYDDFESSIINGNKWLKSIQQGSYVNEFVREIDTDNDVLVLKIGCDNAIYMPRNDLQFQNPETITAIRTDVKIVDYNSDPAYDMPVYARAGGRFYSSASASPSSTVGDIMAYIELGHWPNISSGLIARYLVLEVTSTTGGTSVVDSGVIGAATGLSEDVAYTLEIVYDTNIGFTFRISGGGLSTQEATADGPARAGDSYSGYKVLEARLNTPTPYGSGYIHAEFDNVYINGSGTAYDTFDTDSIDVARWVPPLETVNEIRGGQLAIHKRGGNSMTRNSIPLRDRNTNYLEATIQLEAGSSVTSSTFAFGQARIFGRYYNQTGIDNGFQDDVVAIAGVQLNNFGNLSAFARVVPTGVNGSWGAGDYIYDELFPTAISIDTDYIFSIFFDENNKQFVFKCGSDTLTFNIVGDVFPTNNPARVLETQLILDTDEFGYMKARFDVVYVDDPIYTGLTGDWSSTIYNGWVSDGCGTAYPGETAPIQIQQNECEVSYDSPRGQPFGGVISGSELLLSGLIIEPAGFGAITGVTIDMSSAGSGSGTMQWENNQGCTGGWDTLIGTGGTAVMASGGSLLGVATSGGDLTLAESSETTPEDLDFVHPPMDIDIANVAPGATVDVTIDLPAAAPAEASVYKLIDGVWENIDAHCTFNPQRTSFTFQITDNGWGDNDNTAGQISDPVGIATAVVAPGGTPTGGGSDGGGGGCFIGSLF